MRWKLSPAAPSAEMCAACDGMNDDKHLARGRAFDAYTSMLSVAPSPTDDAELVEEVARHICAREKFYDLSVKGEKLLWSQTGPDDQIYYRETAKSILTLLSVREEGK